MTIVLIGINLTGVGLEAWGGGAFCAQHTEGLFIPQSGCQVLNTTTNEYVASTNCYNNIPINCANGDVFLPFGSPECELGRRRAALRPSAPATTALPPTPRVTCAAPSPPPPPPPPPPPQTWAWASPSLSPSSSSRSLAPPSSATARW